MLAGALALSLAPHVINARRAAGDVYLGFSMYPPDQAVYLSWIEQARQGHWLLGNLFDAHPAPALLPNVTFLAIGKLAALSGTDTLAAYVAARAVAIPALLVAVAALAWVTLPGAGARRLAVAWAMLGTGWGAYFAALHWNGDPDLFDKLIALPWCPADLAMPEFTPAVASANYPHMVIGIALMALAMAGLAVARRRGSAAAGAIAGVIALLAGYAHVYDDLVMLAVVAVLAARAWRDPARLRAALAFLVPASLPALHYAAIFLTDPYLAQWAKVPLPSPSPSAVAIGLGAAAVLAALALRRMPAEPVTSDDELVVSWLCVQAALLYSGPFLYFERRLCEGLWLPFVLLASAEAARRLAALSGARRAAALALLAALVLPTGLVVVHLTARRQPSHRWYFRPAAELRAIAGLSTLLAPGDVLLTEPSVALLVPGLAGRKVAVGHVDHTRNYSAMAQSTLRFWSGQMPPDEARAFLRETGATHYLAFALDRVPPPLGPDVLVPVSRAGTFGLYRIALPR